MVYSSRCERKGEGYGPIRDGGVVSRKGYERVVVVDTGCTGE